MSNNVFAYLTQATETVTSTFVQNGETLTSYYVQAARGPKGDTGTGGGGTWGSITGTLSAQTDLNSALAGKAASSHTHTSAAITDASTGGNGSSDSGKAVKYLSDELLEGALRSSNLLLIKDTVRGHTCTFSCEDVLTGDTQITIPNIGGNLAFCTSPAGAITAADITDAGTTGRSLLQAATVAAASETLGFRGTAAASTVTTSTKDEWVDVSASITIPAGVYHGMVNATFGNATSSSTHFRLLFGSGAVFSSTSDLIGNGVVYTSVGFISGSSSTGAATIGASNSSAITSIPMSASFVVNIPAQTTVKLQVANTSATGTSSVWRHALRLHKP